MTNQVAIRLLNQIRHMLLNSNSWLPETHNPINEAFDMAISALQAQDLPDINVGKMSNKQWIDFLSKQFNISRTSAREMLHGMMCWKKRDNWKYQKQRRI